MRNIVLILVFSSFMMGLRAQCVGVRNVTIPVGGVPVLSDYNGYDNNLLNQRERLNLLEIAQNKSNMGFMTHFQPFYKSRVCYNQNLIDQFMAEPLITEFETCIASFELEVYNGILRFKYVEDVEALYDTLIYFSDRWDDSLENNPEKYMPYIVSEKFPNYPMLYAFETITGFYSLRAKIENELLELEAGDGIPDDNDPDDHFIVSDYMRTLLTPDCEIAIGYDIFIHGDEYTVEIPDLDMDRVQNTKDLIHTLGEEEGMIEACLKGYAYQTEKQQKSGNNCCGNISFDVELVKSNDKCEKTYKFKIEDNSDCSIVSYLWIVNSQAGEEARYYIKEPTHTFISQDNCEVELYVELSNGERCSKKEKVKPKLCEATFSKARRKNKHTFDFEVTATKSCDNSAPIKYVWYFGDGSVDSTSGKKVSYTYTVDGWRNVELHVYFDNGGACVGYFKRTVLPKKTGVCCKAIDREKTKDIYYGSKNDYQLKHVFSVRNVFGFNRIIVKSVNYGKNKKGKYNDRTKADRLHVNYEGATYNEKCLNPIYRKGEGKTKTKQALILYDCGMKDPFRVRKGSIWSIYEAKKGNCDTGSEQEGIYLHDKDCPK